MIFPFRNKAIKLALNLGWAVAVLALFSPSAAAYATSSGSNLAIFIFGLPGSNDFTGRYQMAWGRLSGLLLANGFSPDQIMRFSELPDNESSIKADYFATKEKMAAVFKELSAEGRSYDDVFIFITGHANGRDEEAKFQIPDRDVSYQELMDWVNQIPAKRMVLITALSQGQVWMKKLARPDRVIIAGNGVRDFDFIPISFLHIFPNMFERLSRSEETNERIAVSLKDVFLETQRKVAEWYPENKLFPTETAFFDDNGDGKQDETDGGFAGSILFTVPEGPGLKD